MTAKFKAHLYCTAAAVMFACTGVAFAQADDEAVETVVVTGQRAAIQSAISIKEKADVIVDSVAAEDVGKLPDNSITEVLQRLPGVNIVRLQVGGSSENYYGEGTGISIRGLTSTVSLLNGRDSFSASNGRNLAWEDVPPELAQGVDVYKSLSAALPEGGFGGVVNLRTRQPFDFDGFTASLTASGNYADVSKGGRLGGVGMISDRWQTGIGEFGLLLNIAYSDLLTRADGVQVNPYFPTVYDPDYANSVSTSLPSLDDSKSYASCPVDNTNGCEVYVPGGVGFNRRTDDRVRVGLYAAAQWRPSENLLIGLTAFQSRYTMNDTNRSMYIGSGVTAVIAPYSTNEFDSDGNLTYTSGLDSFVYATAVNGATTSGLGYQPMAENLATSYQHDVNTTTDITLTADWQPSDSLSINAALQYVNSTARSHYNSAAFYIFIDNLGLTLSPYGDSTTPKVSREDGVLDLTNPSNYGWLSTMPHQMHNAGKEVAFYLDGVYTLSDTAFIRKIHGGVKVTSRSERDNETNWNYKALAPYWQTTAYNYASNNTDDAELVDLSDLFGGDVGLPSAMWFPAVSAIMEPIRLQTDYGVDSYADSEILASFSPYTMAKIGENTVTAYAMAAFAKDDWLIPISGNFGLRLVAYRDHASGYRFSPELDSVAIETVTNAPKLTADKQATYVEGGRKQVDVLPSINIQAQITDQLKARFAFSQAVNRPTFAQMNPRGYVSGTYTGNYVGYFGASWGDPNLKPEKAEQIDLSLEYYFPGGGLVHVAGFWKQIHNYISTTQVNEEFTFPVTWASSAYSPGSTSAATICTFTGSDGECTVTAAVTEYFNESEIARIDGFEIGLQKYASFLPDPFDGFGIDFNYTYIDSSQPGALAYDMMENPISGLPVTGLSKNTINIAGMYDKGPLSLRVAYNWRSSFLASTAAWQTAGLYTYNNDVEYSGQQGDVMRYALPVYQYASGQLDANITYNLTDSVSWTLEASNLTKTATRLYMMEGYTDSGKQRLLNRSWYTADTRYTTQLRVKF